ncbi:hypothetical protein VSS74_07310 [Conexibacter stalactiti]|uniref:Rho termination factor N-terminal domain-containing protein n=1 Tax=Conexibacter stalactiti TaxID=1940611 RepID=A0ABU4HLF8_9ACTN|nr:hypothetical protein [Conexibacter stalactiti]MDW5594136.1 hypothetical protein [Conexibacter stalactiti]MEC5034778.1 hypothetical protein [Conexibacter stalactiti]
MNAGYVRSDGEPAHAPTVIAAVERGEGGMNTPHPVHWLSEQTRTGLRDLPNNAAWLLSRALQPAETAGNAAKGAAADTRDTARKVKASVVDAAPVGGDSIETRMQRAQAAAERAHEAEERAIEAAREAKERSEHAREVADHGRARVAEVKRATKQSADERIAEARRQADEAVQRESAAARAEADEQVKRVQAEAEQEAQSARQEAEERQEEAKELLAEANYRLREARHLADEATQVARAVAEEARRQADRLVDDAEQQARQADSRVAAAEQVRADTAERARATARTIQTEEINGDLEAHTKTELMGLAASIDIEGRTNMTKAELVRAIRSAARARRTRS